MLILNFTHPFTPAQRDQLASQLGQEPEIRAIPVHINNDSPLTKQIVAIVDTAELSSEEWQILPIIINPPGFAPAAFVLLAELHGRMGHFPTLLRLRPVVGSVPTIYEVAELLNLQTVREEARRRR